MRGPGSARSDRPVAVVADSSASIPPELAERWGISIAPLWLHLDGRSVRDGTVALVDVMAAEHATTSGPTPGELHAIIDSRMEQGYDVAVLTVASSLSGTHRAACLAAAQAGRSPAGAVGAMVGPEQESSIDAVPQRPSVEVVDSGTAAAAFGLVVLAAARAAASGAGLRDVVGAARRAADGVRLAAGVRSMDRLARSGRVPLAAGWAGRQLGLRPLFELRPGGGIHPLRPALSQSAVVERLVRRWDSSRPAPHASSHLAIAHAMADEELGELAQALASHGAPEPEVVGGFGPAMAAHVGPGLIGLACWWEEAGSEAGYTAGSASVEI